jgi:hypothetical protein
MRPVSDNKSALFFGTKALSERSASDYFFRKSQISEKRFASGVGPEAGAEGISFFNLFMPLIAMSRFRAVRNYIFSSAA